MSLKEKKSSDSLYFISVSFNNAYRHLSRNIGSWYASFKSTEHVPIPQILNLLIGTHLFYLFHFFIFTYFSKLSLETMLNLARYSKKKNSLKNFSMICGCNKHFNSHSAYKIKMFTKPRESRDTDTFVHTHTRTHILQGQHGTPGGFIIKIICPSILWKRCFL